MKQYLKPVIILLVMGYCSIGHSQSLDILLRPYESPEKMEERLDSLQFTKSPVFQSINIENWPIFCKWEEKLQKSSNMAIRFRLGDLETVDKLEGK